MKKTKKVYLLSELAKYVDGKVVGDPKKLIKGVCSIENIRNDFITYVSNEKQLKNLEDKNIGAVIAPFKIRPMKMNMILVDDPKFAFAKVISLFHPQKKFPALIHKSASISPTAILNKGVYSGQNTVICSNAKIGSETVVMANCYIGENVQIGKNTLIYPNVVLLDRVIIGNNVIIHSGVVVGSDGFGYVKKEGRHIKIPQIGSVIIEDDVEIGANCTIDRGTIDDTIIGEGTKIDNLVQIGHNVKIGKRCIIVAMVGISGSCNIGSDVILAGQVGVIDHVKIGDRTIIGGKSGVITDIPSDSFYSGFPARPHYETLRIYSAQKKLPDLLKKISKLKD